MKKQPTARHCAASARNRKTHQNSVFAQSRHTKTAVLTPFDVLALQQKVKELEDENERLRWMLSEMEQSQQRAVAIAEQAMNGLHELSLECFALAAQHDAAKGTC